MPEMAAGPRITSLIAHPSKDAGRQASLSWRSVNDDGRLFFHDYRSLFFYDYRRLLFYNNGLAVFQPTDVPAAGDQQNDPDRGRMSRHCTNLLNSVHVSDSHDGRIFRIGRKGLTSGAFLAVHGDPVIKIDDNFRL